MNADKKIILLKRKFLSRNYIEDFIRHYQEFIDTGITAFNAYKTFRKNIPGFIPNKELDTEEYFWEEKVIPNFLRMRQSSENTLRRVKKNDPDYLIYLGGLAGDFRGLSRGFDGIREEFMDVVDPEIRKKYLALYKQTNKQAILNQQLMTGGMTMKF